MKSTGETPSTFSQLLWCLQLCLTFYSDYVALLLLFRTSSSIIVLGHHVFPIVIRFYVVMLLLFMIKKMAHVYICCYVPECGSFFTVINTKEALSTVPVLSLSSVSLDHLPRLNLCSLLIRRISKFFQQLTLMELTLWKQVLPQIQMFNQIALCN